MRLPRYVLPGQPLHIIQRGNNRQAIFYTQQDAVNFLTWLEEAAGEHGLAVHAYVLMPNHVHLLASAEGASSLARAMQTLGRRYVRYLNTRLQRSGTLWEGRYRASPIDTDRYFFQCSRYIELNPVRARLADEPAGYRWSSYHANAIGNADALVKPHVLYLALAADERGRAAAYRDLFAENLSPTTLTAIRVATNGGWALGDDEFKLRMADVSGRRTQPLRRGRKRHPAPAELTRAFLD